MRLDGGVQRTQADITDLESDDLTAGLDAIEAGLALLGAESFTPATSSEARSMIQRFEVIGSRIDAARTDLLAAIDRRGLHAEDGHATAKVMVRHVGRLRGGEATGRARSATAMVALPRVATAYRRGEFSTCVMRKIAEAHANARVREALVEDEHSFVSKARVSDYPQFERWVNDWIRRTDEDGTCDRNERNHGKRDARLIQEFDQSWGLLGNFGAYQGAELDDIFRHFIDAEFRADWEKAQIEHGDRTCVAHLERTDAQRRADALAHIFELAARSASDTKRQTPTTNVKIDLATYERWLRKLAGAEVENVDVHDSNYVCETLDGAQLEPGEVVARSLIGHVRRVVVDATSVTVDLGRKRRLFVGNARAAVQLADIECLWPGCHVPCSSCQIDHNEPWAAGRGCTCPDNGGPLCGRHNRLKEHRFETRRDSTGRWRTYRPDGSEIE